jgi:PBSX family phage terminase large subunit
MKEVPTLHHKQEEFIASDKRYKLLCWGRRAGKTFAVGYEILIALVSKNNALVSYYAPTRDDARNIAWEDFKDLLEPITVKTNEQMLEIEVRTNHGGTSLLRLSGWEAVKNRDKGRGVENDLVVLDEAAFFPMFVEKFEKVIEPTLLTSKGRLIITSTPNGFNHFYDLFNKSKQDPDWFVSHCTSYDNPHNDPVEIDKLRDKKDPDAFAQEYLADFRKVQGLVYKSFDIGQHVVTTLLEPSEVVLTVGAIDFGFTNPTAMIQITKDRKGVYWLYNEFYETGKTTPELIQHMHSRKCEYWYPDPAEPDRIEEMRRSGLSTREVSKDIKAGINTVQTLFRENRIKIDSRCTNLIFELNSYRWREPNHSSIDMNEPELPVKEHDHLLDALRYALHMMETVGKGNEKIKDFYKNLERNVVLNPNRTVGAAS